MGMSEHYFTDFMDYEIMRDFLISNTDRQMIIFEVMRNPDTVVFKKARKGYNRRDTVYINPKRGSS